MVWDNVLSASYSLWQISTIIHKAEFTAPTFFSDGFYFFIRAERRCRNASNVVVMRRFAYMCEWAALLGIQPHLICTYALLVMQKDIRNSKEIWSMCTAPRLMSKVGCIHAGVIQNPTAHHFMLGSTFLDYSRFACLNISFFCKT